jgi:hypothetical protein
MLLILGVALLAALPWTVQYWPSQDGPNHLATAHIVYNYYDTATPFARYLLPGSFVTRSGYSFSPSNLQYVILLGLHNFVNLPVAAKLLASFLMIALPVSLGILLRRVAPGRMRNIFLLLPLFSGWALGMGFERFLLACVFGFLTLAMSIEVAPRQKSAWLRLTTAGACFYLCAWAHPFIAVLFGITLLVLHADALRRSGGWRDMLVITVPAAFLVLVCLLVGADGSLSTGGKTEWWGLADILWGLCGYHVGISAQEYLPRGVALLVMYILCISAFHADAARCPRFRTWRFILSFEGRWCRAVILLHLLYLALPAVLDDWYFCSARALIIGTFLLPLAIETQEVPDRLLRRLPVFCFLLTVVILGVQYRQAVRFSSTVGNVVAVGSQTPRGSRLLPVCGYDAAGLPNPLHHAWAYLVLSCDIITPYHTAGGKPATGGSRFRMLSYRPGVLEGTGAMPWLDEEEIRKDCAVSGKSCRQTLDRLEPVFRKYDRLLLIRPSKRLLAAMRVKCKIEQQAGDVFLLSIPR